MGDTATAVLAVRKREWVLVNFFLVFPSEERYLAMIERGVLDFSGVILVNLVIWSGERSFRELCFCVLPKNKRVFPTPLSLESGEIYLRICFYRVVKKRLHVAARTEELYFPLRSLSHL